MKKRYLYNSAKKAFLCISCFCDTYRGTKEELLIIGMLHKNKIERRKLNIFCLNEKGEPTIVDDFFW